MRSWTSAFHQLWKFFRYNPVLAEYQEQLRTKRKTKKNQKLEIEEINQPTNYVQR